MELIDIDLSEVQENMNDEVLISLVRENPVLYDKTLKNYKNKEIKCEIWKHIGEILGCTGEQVEGRWITLRNTFTKKLREIKTGQPSGSGSKMTKMWVYFKQMSFLTPHIAHRMSRSSITSQQESSMTSQSMSSSILTEDSTMKTIMSPVSLNNAWSSINLLKCTDDSSPSFDGETSSLSTSIASPASDQCSDQQFSVTIKDSEDVSEYVINRKQKKIAADNNETMNNMNQRKKVVPPSDQFVTKKQKTETIENVLCQSSHALNVMATAYLNRASTEQLHPYITAIAEAMKQVPNEQQLTCFMSIMQIISNHSRDKKLLEMHTN